MEKIRKKPGPNKYNHLTPKENRDRMKAYQRAYGLEKRRLSKSATRRTTFNLADIEQLIVIKIIKSFEIEPLPLTGLNNPTCNKFGCSKQLSLIESLAGSVCTKHMGL